ncbi:MAG: hypothetical protein ABJF50_01935 [Paracoccaceae bacterium]
MTLLPAILVLMLVTFVVWFFWPNVVDPLTRSSAARSKRTEADTVAEDLFEVWAKHGRAKGLLMPDARNS